MGFYQNWFLAARPWSFTMSLISVSVGGSLAALDGGFHWPLYGLTLLGVVALHAATNMVNDYFDVSSGVDTLEAATAQYRPHPLLEGKVGLRQVMGVIIVLYCLSAIIGLYLAYTRGWIILGLGLVGAVASLSYTGPPFKYKYNALGELSVFLMWGPLMVEGAYFVQRQTLSFTALWVSLPFGVLVALVLLANNLRDLAHDKDHGIRTLPILLGKSKGLVLFATLVVLAYLSILWMSLRGPLSLWSLIVFLSLPLAFGLLKNMRLNIPDDADARTAQLDTVFGVLLVISLIGERLF